MSKKKFDWEMLSSEDQKLAKSILRIPEFWAFEELPQPDLTIAPDGNPYLHRWELVRGQDANVYLHVQVSDDPERPLHDHPWDNQSVILAGAYRELMCGCSDRPTARNTIEWHRKKKDVIWRKADWSHRLFMPADVDYTMTLFSTGPKTRDWGFWYPNEWISWDKVTEMRDGQSVHVRSIGGGPDVV